MDLNSQQPKPDSDKVFFVSTIAGMLFLIAAFVHMLGAFSLEMLGRIGQNPLPAVRLAAIAGLISLSAYAFRKPPSRRF